MGEDDQSEPLDKFKSVRQTEYEHLGYDPMVQGAAVLCGDLLVAVIAGFALGWFVGPVAGFLAAVGTGLTHHTFFAPYTAELFYPAFNSLWGIDK